MYKYIKDYDKENHEMRYIVNQYGVDMIFSKDIIIDDQNKEIKRLKQGYCELKEKCNRGECDCTHEEYNEMCKQNMKMDLEIERLNNDIKILLKENENKEKVILKYDNIIKELEKWLEEQIKISQAHDNQLGVNVCNTFKNKLNELKGDSSNDNNGNI